MKILVLDRADSWHVSDLQRVAEHTDCQIAAVEYHDLSVRLPNQECDQQRFAKSDFFGEGANVGDYDAIVTRAMPGSSLEQIVFRMDWLDQVAFQQKKLVVNPAKTIEACVDKYLSLEKMRAAGLPVPKTNVSQTASEAIKFFHESGSDTVVKPIFGSQGRNIVRVSNEIDSMELFRTLESKGNVVYQQEYIEHGDWDLRLLVIGSTVFAMKRTRIGHWITNASLGAECTPHDATDDEAELAIAATHSQNALLAGIDLVYRDSHPVIVEVNACPSWKTISEVTGHDIAGELLQLVKQLA